MPFGEKIKGDKDMILRKVYLDIEATYNGDIDPSKSQGDRERFFKDFSNWKFCCERRYNGKNVRYEGMIGILILDFDIDKDTRIHKLISKRFVQLIGKDITKERLMKEIEGMNEIIGYHCRTKPNQKGYIGYDFGVIGAQLGVILDELPDVKCTDIELLCHSNGIYGGLKETEKYIPSIPPRRSGINNGAEAEKILLGIAFCEDESKRKDMWKRVKMYNHEDVVSLVYIEQYLKKIKMTE